MEYRRPRPVYRGPTPGIRPRMVSPHIEPYIPAAPPPSRPQLHSEQYRRRDSNRNAHYYGFNAPEGVEVGSKSHRGPDLNAHYYGFNAPEGVNAGSTSRHFRQPIEREKSPDLFDFSTEFKLRSKKDIKPSRDPDPYNYYESGQRPHVPVYERIVERSDFEDRSKPSANLFNEGIGYPHDFPSEDQDPYRYTEASSLHGKGLLPPPIPEATEQIPRKSALKKHQRGDYRSELDREKALQQLERQLLGHDGDHDEGDSFSRRYGGVSKRSQHTMELYEGREEPLYAQPEEAQYARPKGTEQYDEFGYDRTQHGDVSYQYCMQEPETKHVEAYGIRRERDVERDIGSRRRHDDYHERDYTKKHKSGKRRSRDQYGSRSRSRSEGRDRPQSRDRDRSHSRDRYESHTRDEYRSHTDEYRSRTDEYRLADGYTDDTGDRYKPHYKEEESEYYQTPLISATQTPAKMPKLYVDFNAAESEHLLTSYQPREINQDTLRAQEIGMTTSQIEERNARGLSEEKEYEEEEEEEEQGQKKPSAQSIAELNMKCPGITYTFIRQGSVHKPIFLCQCTVRDESFFGYGGTKKEAKQICAQNALDVLEGDDTWQSSQAPNKPTAPHVAAYHPQQIIKNPLEMPESGKVGDGQFSVSEERLLSYIGKHPVQIMLELQGVGYDDHTFTWRQSTLNKCSVFTAILTINGGEMVFHGSAGAKKEAKKNAAREAVIHYFGFDPTADQATQENQIHDLYKKLNAQCKPTEQTTDNRKPDNSVDAAKKPTGNGAGDVEMKC